MLKDKIPRSISVDKGTEFRSAKFQAVADKNGILLDFKDAQDGNGPLARLDTAIGQFKRNTRRLQELGKGKTWLALIDRATKAFNASHHGGTGAPPNDLPDSVILEQKKLAA